MKNTLITSLILLFFITSCKKNDDNLDENPFLSNAVFDTGSVINTNLPQYNHMQFANNFVVLNNNYGINGVVVYYAGGENYSAFELSDPNHHLDSCSTLSVEGIIATCTCEDGNSYEILNGSPQNGTSGQYFLKRYFVQANGNIIRVYNN